MTEGGLWIFLEDIKEQFLSRAVLCPLHVWWRRGKGQRLEHVSNGSCCHVDEWIPVKPCWNRDGWRLCVSPSPLAKGVSPLYQPDDHTAQGHGQPGFLVMWALFKSINTKFFFFHFFLYFSYWRREYKVMGEVELNRKDCFRCCKWWERCVYVDCLNLFPHLKISYRGIERCLGKKTQQFKNLPAF